MPSGFHQLSVFYKQPACKCLYYEPKKEMPQDTSFVKKYRFNILPLRQGFFSLFLLAVKIIRHLVDKHTCPPDCTGKADTPDAIDRH